MQESKQGLIKISPAKTSETGPLESDSLRLLRLSLNITSTSWVVHARPLRSQSTAVRPSMEQRTGGNEVESKVKVCSGNSLYARARPALSSRNPTGIPVAGYFCSLLGGVSPCVCTHTQAHRAVRGRRVGRPSDRVCQPRLVTHYGPPMTH